MTDVATGRVNIQEKNNEYKQIFQELDDIFTANAIENPNNFSDLWEFYNYWKKQGMGTYAQRRLYVIGLYKKVNSKKVVLKSGAYSFVNPARIKELKLLINRDFDFSKLIKFCEEMNIVFSRECYLSTAMLTRAVIDHIPPIFSKSTFSEVANNYGSKSFQDLMKNLDNSSRKISDSHLHTQIRKKEVLPNSNQIDFSNDLDVLLAEIYRILR